MECSLWDQFGNTYLTKILALDSNTTDGLSYGISGNISGYRNKVTKLPADVENAYGGNGKGDNILGHPINSFYGYIADGLFRSEEEVLEHATQNGGEGVGRIRYRDIKQDGKIDEDDRTWIGSPHPDFHGQDSPGSPVFLLLKISSSSCGIRVFLPLNNPVAP